MDLVGPAVGAAVGIGISVAVSVAVWALGFTPAGIAARSLAARLMSVTAIANGGGVSARSLVAVLQSLGAGGLPMSVKTVLPALGAVMGAIAF
ncbi:interferon alpha-inducible protein 27-like protein 2A [Pezoporus flaviventris]|uniref:interferon alpha-inducible protein 27-like protein 2A n=1 Tax=Pezoporus flaviventris TaxID=889875 RepID=UPI002AB2C15D|nr:interferon alpha-inducible protein 27-like protein 2A [Pezoporus flaviventris]